MKPFEIESWSLRIIEMVKKGKSVEDSRVELKAEWPEKIEKAARILAGHANAARGENILWLVGVDEKQGGVGADYQELATWFPKVKSEFDGIVPTMQNLNIIVDGQTVAALCFATSRAPYVIQNPVFGSQGAGSVQFEP